MFVIISVTTESELWSGCAESGGSYYRERERLIHGGSGYYHIHTLNLAA